MQVAKGNEVALPEGGMRVTRVSGFTGETHVRDLPITADQMKRWHEGQDLIQNIFPDLSPDQREFLMTGVTPEEWSAVFPAESEESDEVE